MSTETAPAPTVCEWCSQPSDKPAQLCRRCRIVQAEEQHIWDAIEGQRW